MRLISRFVSLLVTPLVIVYSVSAQAPAGSSSVAKDAAQDLQIRVLPGEASGTGRLIEVTNANGVGIADVAVVFRLPDSAPTGVFSDGTHAAVAYTDQGGRAAIPRIQWDSAAGIPPIRVSATKGTAHAGILVEQNVSAGAASAPAALVPGLLPLPTPPPPPVQQPGTIARVSGIPAQAPSPEPKVSITSATPASEAHSGKTKWIVIAVVAIGAGVGVAMAMKGKSSSSTSSTSGTTVSYSGLGVGQPPH